MNEGGIPILTVPERKLSEHRVWQVDRDSIRGREVAGPFFDAGGISMALAELPNYSGDLHIPECHRFFLVLQGRMKVRLGRDIIIANTGDLVCMPAGGVTSRAGLGPIVVIYIQFDDTPLWAPLKSLGPSVRQYESTDLLYILLNRIIKALQSQDVYSIRCAWENSDMLVTLMKRELHQSSNEWTSDLMKRIIDLLKRIRTNPELKWDRASMAKAVNMSDRNMARAFQRIFNIPPAKMLNTIRMDIAANMLMKTDLPLSVIANTVGYDSPFSFSRLFKQHTGVSPGRYRHLPAGQKLPSPL